MRKPRRKPTKTPGQILRKNRKKIQQKLKCKESASKKPVEKSTKPVVKEHKPVKPVKPVEPVIEQEFYETRRRVTYRLVLTKAQCKKADNLLEDQRRLYNFARQYCANVFFETGEILTEFYLNNMVPIWQEEHPELGLENVARTIQRGTLKRLPQAFKDCRRHKRKIDKLKAQGKKVKREPRLVPKYKDKEDFQSIVVPERVKIVGNKLYIPRLEGLRIRRKGGNPYPQGTPCTATLTKKYGKWYASIVFKVQIPVPVDNGKVLGVDRNVRQIADSEGNFYRIPDTKKLEAKIAQLQRRAARCRKGSNRWRRFRTRIGRLKTHIACIKHNHNHHVSKILTGKASTIILEDLNTKGMMASARGTVENPGKNVKAKTGLNRGIQGSNWYQLEKMIEYKAYNVLYIEPAYTSQTCYACGM